MGRFEIHPDARLGAYAIGLGVGALAVVGGLVESGARLRDVPAVVALALIALLAETQSVRITPSFELSIASLPLIFAAVVLGPLAAVAVGVTGLLPDLFRRDVAQPYLRWLIWTASRALVAAGVGVAASGVASHQGGHGLTPLLATVAAAAAADVIGDLVLAPLPAVIRGTSSWRAVLGALVPVQLSALPLHIPVITLLAYAYLRVSPWSAVLFVIPAFAAQRLFVLYRKQRETSDELSGANARLARANLSFATALVATLDARDRYTAGHSAAVAIYARDIAARMGLSDQSQRLAHLAGLVHDIGKIGLPPGLLEKPGALTLDERRQMEAHSVIGERILAKVDDYAEIASVVRSHHERVDGHGYPDGLKAQEIPLLSRILAVADSYNAMTSDRPYRDAMPSRVARLRLAQAVESQFDTSVVAAFEALLAGASEKYRRALEADFSVEVCAELSGPSETVAA